MLAPLTIASLGSSLVGNGIISEADLLRAQHLCAREGKRLAATLTRLAMASEQDVAEVFAQTHGLPLRQRSDLLVDASIALKVNRRFCEARAVLPLGCDEDRLFIAMADPADEAALSGLLFATGTHQAEISVATFGDIAECWAAFSGDVSPHDPRVIADHSAADDLDRLADDDSDAPVIRLVQRLLTQAVNRRASDVHIEPMARHIVVRYRIDGRLMEVEQLPDHLGPAIATRIKVMAALDIAESRLPQDGRLRLTVRGRDVDVRVATSPIAHGESIVLRLLGRSDVALDPAALGLPTEVHQQLLQALSRPHGILLITGPTGSGKTTTLYAALNHLRRPEVKILTVEDPVEILLEGVNQVQVRPEIALDYPATLRAFLRQDPDILMIGEIRDGETADIAMRAALTGHLVLSTLHTNSAIGAFARLADFGVEPFLTASSVVASMAQRLVRKLCTRCAIPRAATKTEKTVFETHGLPAPDALHDAGGCEACGHSGYHGRAPVTELFVVDEAARIAIRDGSISSFDDGRAGAQTLAGHGLMLAAQGITSMTEVDRVVLSA